MRQYISILISLTCALLLVAGSAHWAAAQDNGIQPAPLPAGKLLQSAPDFATWKIAFTYKDDPTKSSPPPDASSLPNATAPRVVTVTRTKSLWHAAQSDKAGKISQSWFDGSVLYLRTPDYPRPTVHAGAEETKYIPKFLVYGGGNPAFPGFEWVSRQTYVGTQTIRSVSCIVFRQSGGETAWIDAESRLPVCWAGKGEVRNFFFQTPPSEVLTLPPEVASLSKTLSVIRENYNRKPPRGG